MYEKEITPTVSLHAIKALKEEIEDVTIVKRMLNILSSHFFDDKCILILVHLLKSQIHFTDDTKKKFNINGGIDCLVDCYEKHNDLAKDIIHCLANVVEEDSTKSLFTSFSTSFSDFFRIKRLRSFG